jgi:hypothetical protein
MRDHFAQRGARRPGSTGFLGRRFEPVCKVSFLGMLERSLPSKIALHFKRAVGPVAGRGS